MTVTAVPRPRPTPPLRVLLGHLLRRHRLSQRRTLAHVAREARVSTQYLSELERGRKEASSEVLAALCRALGLDLADLLGELREEVLVLRSTTSPPVLRTGPVGGPTLGGTSEPVLRAA